LKEGDLNIAGFGALMKRVVSRSLVRDAWKRRLFHFAAW